MTAAITYDVDAYVAGVERRVFEDAWLEAGARHWDQRASTFDTVATADDDRGRRCTAVATACRNRASYLRGHGRDPATMNRAEAFVWREYVDQPWAYPVELGRETAEQMILRHRRVVAVLGRIADVRPLRAVA